MKGTPKVFETGNTLYSPYYEDNEVFVILSGYVMAYTHDDDGKRRIHLIYGPRAYFPVLTTFKDTEQRATYEAISRVVVKSYSKAEFLHELDTNIEFCRLVLDKTIDQLAIFADRVINLQITRVEDRLISRLNILARAHGNPDSKGLKLPYKLKHHHLADMLGVERESVSRALVNLKDKNLIVYDAHSGQIVIKSQKS